jgi:hypothetical protein
LDRLISFATFIEILPCPPLKLPSGPASAPRRRPPRSSAACDLSGKIAVVTGGYSGIGLETTRVLHFAGPKPIVPARDYSKAVAALTGLDDVEAMDLLEPPLARLRQANGARVVSMSSWGCRHQCLVPSIPKRLTPFGV